MGDLVFLVIWCGLLAFIFLMNRMSRFYHREATFWYTHIQTLDIIIGLRNEHPEYSEAYNRLLVALKANGDFHKLMEEDMSYWDRLKDGGRLPSL